MIDINSPIDTVKLAKLLKSKSIGLIKQLGWIGIVDNYLLYFNSYWHDPSNKDSYNRILSDLNQRIFKSQLDDKFDLSLYWGNQLVLCDVYVTANFINPNVKLILQRTNIENSNIKTNCVKLMGSDMRNTNIQCNTLSINDSYTRNVKYIASDVVLTSDNLTNFYGTSSCNRLFIEPCEADNINVRLNFLPKFKELYVRKDVRDHIKKTLGNNFNTINFYLTKL